MLPGIVELTVSGFVMSEAFLVYADHREEVIGMRHTLSTLDMCGRVIHPFEAMLIDHALRQNLLVRMCTCGQICAGATMDDVQLIYNDHAVGVL